MKIAGLHGAGAIATVLVLGMFTPASANDPGRRTVGVADVVGEGIQTCSVARVGDTCEPEGLPSMLEEYLVCSRMAEVRILNLIEVLACTEAGLAVRLSFIAGFEPHSYRRLPLGEQIEMNLRAYRAYRNWIERFSDNPSSSCTQSRGCGA